MKHLLILLLFVTLFACSDNKKVDNSSSKDTLTSVNNSLLTPKIEENILMRYKFKKGDSYKYKITTKSNSYQELVSDSTIRTEANQNIEYKIRIDVTDVDTSKVAKLNLFIESVIVEGNINGQEITYNSKYIQSTQERLMFAQYEAIKNKRFSLNIAENGEILDIYNTDAMVVELVAIQEITTKLTAQQKKELGNNFIASALRPLSEQIFRKFPNKKLGINSTWDERYFTQFAAFQIENIVTFQIKKIEPAKNDSIIVMSAGLSINWTGEHKANDNGLEFYFYDPIVSGSGIIKFNNSLGIVTYSETTTNMEIATDISGIDENNKPFTAKRIDNSSNTNIVELVR